MYQGNPSIADRMKVLDFKNTLLRKQEGADGMASMPGQVSPPAVPPAPSPNMGAAPDASMMDAMGTATNYASSEEFMQDISERFRSIAVDITQHIGTVDMQATMGNMEMSLPNKFKEHLKAYRDRTESMAEIIGQMRMDNPEMIAHGTGAPDPMMASQGEMPPMNMPSPGPAGMPPGGMANAGPMGGM